MTNVTTKMLAQAFLKLKSMFTDLQGTLIPATSDRSGLMSADDKFQLDSKGNYYKGLNGGEDILELPLGKYVSRSLVNRPAGVDDSICAVNIAGWKDYKHIEFHWLIANRTYWRDIYSTTDSGWHTSEWVNIPLNNGFSGKARVRLVPGLATRTIEITYDLTCSITTADVIDFGTLPKGYQQTVNNDMPIYSTHRASGGTTSVPIGFMLHQGKDLAVYREDMKMVSPVGIITQVSGHEVLTIY